jgi:hypothetical protein
MTAPTTNHHAPDTSGAFHFKEESAMTTEAPEPALRLLSLGAGVQSSALLILAARGDLPGLDGAIFADTGWEPESVYKHLDRLENEIAKPAGIPIYRVSSGNIRNDALDPNKRFATMPMFIKSPCKECDGTGVDLHAGKWVEVDDPEDVDAYFEGRLGDEGIRTRKIWHEPFTSKCTECSGTGITQGIQRRQCTSEYKLKPIKQKVRELLGYPHPKPLPKGLFVEQWVGISTDEESRSLDSAGNLKTGDVKYSRIRYPLLELDMSREKCRTLLNSYGFGQTPKSACIGCPFHTNAHWRMIKENPADWEDAVDFDKKIRKGSARANALGQPLRGEAFLHRAMLPLDQAPLTRDGFKIWAGRQGDVMHMLSVNEYEEKLSAEDRDSLTGCSILSDCGPDDEESEDAT